MALGALRAAKAEGQARRTLHAVVKDARANPHAKRLLAELGWRRRLGEWRSYADPRAASLEGALGVIGGLVVMVAEWGRVPFIGAPIFAAGAARLLRAVATLLRKRYPDAATALYWLSPVAAIAVVFAVLLGLLR